VEYFANNGLRTLMFAYKELQSLGSLTREDVECNLTILGATAVEDLM
jgi:magnesium-transporting ATPase (P-type)